MDPTRPLTENPPLLAFDCSIPDLSGPSASGGDGGAVYPKGRSL